MTWIRPIVKGLLPQARNAQTVTVVGTKLFLFGGHSGNKHLRDLHLFDTETYTWSQPDVKGHVPPGQCQRVVIAWWRVLQCDAVLSLALC